MYRELKQDREVAAGLGRSAQILAAAHRYPEAEARYAEAMQAAQAAGDLELQGMMLQHQAFLHRNKAITPAPWNCSNKPSPSSSAPTIPLTKCAPATCSPPPNCSAANWMPPKPGMDAPASWQSSCMTVAQLATDAQNLGILYQTRAEALAAGRPSPPRLAG